jgi:aspartyl aminopeptidase
LHEHEQGWLQKIHPTGKYYVTRNNSALIAFAVGSKYLAGNPISIVGAHTDSPCLKIKPRSNREKLGHVQVGVETYGGGLWHTWFDRDLSIAGRVVVSSGGSDLSELLLHVKRSVPVLVCLQ